MVDIYAIDRVDRESKVKVCGSVVTLQLQRLLGENKDSKGQEGH